MMYNVNIYCLYLFSWPWYNFFFFFFFISFSLACLLCVHDTCRYFIETFIISTEALDNRNTILRLGFISSRSCSPISLTSHSIRTRYVFFLSLSKVCDNETAFFGETCASKMIISGASVVQKNATAFFLIFFLGLTRSLKMNELIAQTKNKLKWLPANRVTFLISLFSLSPSRFCSAHIFTGLKIV